MRAHQWLLLFERKYADINNLDFDDVVISGKFYLWGGIPDSISKWGDREIDGGRKVTKDDSIIVFGDAGWKFFWDTMPKNLFGNFTDELYNCWEHKNNQSCRWYKENKEKIKEWEKLNNIDI
jgi:hypothetical protein